VALRHRIELYAAFFCSWYLQQRLWAVVDDEGVRVIINYNDIMFLSKANKTLVFRKQRIYKTTTETTTGLVSRAIQERFLGKKDF
jgi:hypothetical protein